MLSGKPPYFEEIRRKAERRWDQLEQDPELAGPWHQLFKQVQSPRHVLSELLQNADDAGATEASVRIADQVFVFEHNGVDFADEHFASLCRFGYSNKRSLHTIGFRGIGFKSTFSLGSRVELCTPTLSVGFNGKRFTEPFWLDGNLRADRKTCVRVPIQDKHRQKELERNFEEWIKSPISLLFFRNLRRIQIDEETIHWASLGPGPVARSEWMARYEDEDNPVLLIRSEAEAFPDDALEEIRQERTLTEEDQNAFPPCQIEIVLGAEGRLFVVLPTGVETDLPFACNAPFIAKPDRDDIKDPSISPTNRWLLERAGKLAAEAMLEWLGKATQPTAERASAYGLFPDVDRESTSLDGVCGTIVEETFADTIEGEAVLLTDSGELVASGEAVIVPDAIFDIWPAEQATALLDDERRPALSHHIAPDDRQKLLRWNLVEEISKQTFLATLRSKHLPKPGTWRQLLNLWAYVAPEPTGYWRYQSFDDLRILPVQGKEVLYAPNEVARIGEKKLLQSDKDWEFLSEYLLVLNQNWPRFLADQRRAAESKDDDELRESVEAAYALLEKTGLDESSDVDKVIDQVAAQLFTQGEIEISDCVRLAQIAAKLNAEVDTSFRFVATDETLQSAGHTVYFDEDGWLEELIPPELREDHLLHPDYTARFEACSREDWLKWVSQGKSGLHAFVPITQRYRTVYGRTQIAQEARKRGAEGDFTYHYVTNQFVIEDWDFDETYWRHWTALAHQDAQVWGNVAERIFAQRESYWSQSSSARIRQVATTGNSRSIYYQPLLPSWALRLRDLPCLPDTYNVYRKPRDLLRRTPETESLIDVEHFVSGLLDRETTRPLLDLLGVASTPVGPDRLLDRLRALAKADNPPVHEVEKLYRRLDQMMSACSTATFLRIKRAFNEENLILSSDHAWMKAAGVFLSSDEEDAPGAAIILLPTSDLTIWRKVGVQERPTADLALEWLGSLPSGKVLSSDDARRARALLARYPVRIWEELGHWLNLAGEWAPTEKLTYALSMQSLIPWRHLYQWVKQQTADMQRLAGDITGAPPFSLISPLAGAVEERFQRGSIFGATPEVSDWIVAVGKGLSRIKLDSEEETHRVRSLAEALAMTKWMTAPGLEIVPYIDGTPAGTPRRADVLWLGEVLYADELSKAKLAKRVPEEISRLFNRADIKTALDYSFERRPGDVREYLEENFDLAAQSEVQTARNGHAVSAEDDNESSPKELEDADQVAEADTGHEDHTTAEDDSDTTVDHDDEPQPDARTPTQPRPRPKQPKLSIIERFARSQGFKRDGEDRFYHDNGSWIARANDLRFPWEQRAASGELERFYWPKDHCIQEGPLQLEADVWSLIDQYPDKYALVLSGADGAPTEVTGVRLRAMCDRGELTLYPATYRIVYNHDKHS